MIAGEVAGHRGPGSTFTPITLVHATVSPGAELALPWDESYNALVYVLGGQGSAGTERRPVRKGELVVFGPGGALTIAASPAQSSAEPNLEVLLLGGRPIGEPVVHWGPFVMNTQSEIATAMEDYQAGRLGREPVAEN